MTAGYPAVRSGTPPQGAIPGSFRVLSLCAYFAGQPGMPPYGRMIPNIRFAFSERIRRFSSSVRPMEKKVSSSVFGSHMG